MTSFAQSTIFKQVFSNCISYVFQIQLFMLNTYTQGSCNEVSTEEKGVGGES